VLWERLATTQTPATTRPATSAVRTIRFRHEGLWEPAACLSMVCILSPSGQVRAHGAFKRYARRVGVEQNIGVTRLDIDKAALFRDHIK